MAALDADRDALPRGGASGRAAACRSSRQLETAALLSPERAARRRFEEAWEAGELFGSSACSPTMLIEPGGQRRSSPSSSASKIRSIVDDPETAETLCPTDHPFGTKRPCLDTNYYETFNLPHVRLVDLRKTPIDDDHRDRHRHRRRVVRVRRHRLRHRLRRDDRRARRASTSPAATASRSRRSGPHGPTHVPRPDDRRVPEPVHDHRARAARRCCRTWWCRSSSTSTGSPTASTTCATHGVERDRADRRRPRPAGCSTSTTAPTSRCYPTANSWYMGANVPGKPRVFLPYVGGVDALPRRRATRSSSATTSASSCAGPDGAQCNDGVIRRLQPDVADGARR